MYQIKRTGKFKKDLKTIINRRYNLDLLDKAVMRLAKGETLPPKYCNHELSGNWAGYRECHISPNWLLVYQYDNINLFLHLVRTGTHSDLFE